LRRKCVRSCMGFASSRSICSRRFFSLSSFRASSATAREAFFLAEGLLEDIDHGPIAWPVGGPLTGDDIRQRGNYYGFPFQRERFGRLLSALKDLTRWMVVMKSSCSGASSRMIRYRPETG